MQVQESVTENRTEEDRSVQSWWPQETRVQKSRPPSSQGHGKGWLSLTSPCGGAVTCPVCSPGCLAPGTTHQIISYSRPSSVGCQVPGASLSHSPCVLHPARISSFFDWV